MGTDDQIGDLRERLARMEERQLSLYKMVETSLSNYADVVNRISSLEHLRTKALAIAGVVGLICSMAWDVIKNRLSN
jgi:hypothetical protein